MERMTGTLHDLIGEWGPYQRRIFVLISLPLAMTGFCTMMGVIILHVPGHRCQVPGPPTDTYFLQDEGHRLRVNRAVPPDAFTDLGYSQCVVFKPQRNGTGQPGVDTNTVLLPDGNGTGVNTYTALQPQGNRTGLDGDRNVTRSVTDNQQCQSWVYDLTDVDSSVVTQFDLVCPRKAFRSHINMAFLFGTMVGSVLSGILCDWLGRRTVFVICNVLALILGVVSAFPPSVEVFLAIRFFLGAIGMATYLAAYVLVVELVGPKRRTMAGSVCTIVWLVGPFSVAGVSFFVRHWRDIQLISALPLVLCLGHWWLLPESPRWLLLKKRVQPALAVVRKAARVNRIPEPPNLETKLEKISDVEEEHTEKASNVIRQLFQYPRLVFKTVVIFFNWFVISLTYYGLSLNVGNLGGSVRVNFLLSCAVELVGYLAGWFLLERLGRKRSHCCFMLTAGLACLTTIFTVSLGGKDWQWATTALAMVGKLGVSASFTSIFLISAEVFPTVMRNLGLGCSSAVGRVGSGISPYVADLALFVGGEYGRAVPLVVFGGLGTLAGLSAFFLPETLHRPLPDTMLEAATYTQFTRTNTSKTKRKEMTPLPNYDTPGHCAL